jgi:uncharacterized membrane protein
VYLEFSGAVEARAQSQREILLNSFIAAVIIVCLLYIAFGNVRNLLLVLVNVPFALVGGVLAALLAGGELSLGSMVGFVTLFGLTMRNSIMMISHFEHLVPGCSLWRIGAIALAGTDALGRGEAELLNLMMRRILHRFFELGMLIKGVDGGLELVGGLLLVFLSPAAINRVVFFFVEGELKEDPTDLVANLLLHTTRSAIQVRVPASVFLIVHGIVKLVLVAGLATGRLWSYPAAFLVFAGFTVYQFYQLTQQYSLFLEAVTILDVVVILLIIAEYRQMRIARTHKL